MLPPPKQEVCLKVSLAVAVVVIAVPSAAAAAGSKAVCPATVFGGARTLLSRIPADERDTPGTGRVESENWAAFDRAVEGILGDAVSNDEAARRIFVTAIASDNPDAVPCDQGMVNRDRWVQRMAMVGYPAADIARLLHREARRADIDADYVRRMAGYPVTPARAPRAETALAAAEVRPTPAPTTVALAEPAPLRNVPRPDPLPVPPAAAKPTPKPARRAVARASVTDARPDPSALDAYIEYYATAYKVDPRLVYAMIRQESNWNRTIESPKGALGLMQLMPATATMLQVDPRDPVQNIRGGIAYLAALLKTYGSVRHALIAYNAGPTHANQVIRGERTLYGETRRYLQAIGAAYPLD